MEVKKKTIASVIIEESKNSLEFFNIIFSFGYNPNSEEVYRVGPQLNSQTDRCSNPLTTAVMQGKFHDVKYLLENKAQPNICPCAGKNIAGIGAMIVGFPLMIAIKNKRLDIAELLIAKGAIIHADVLLYAVKQKDKEAVSFLLKHDANPLLKFQSTSAYEQALLGGDDEIIEMMSDVVHSK